MKTTIENAEINQLMGVERLKEAAAFLSQNLRLHPEYISHGECFGDRATEPGVWAPDLEDIIQREFQTVLTDPDSETRIYALDLRGVLRGLAVVRISRTTFKLKTYAVLEDIAIAESDHGQGLGGVLFDWVINQARTLGATELWLESGQHNEVAHGMFHSRGVDMTSMVFRKSLI